MTDLYGQIKDSAEKLTAAIYRVTDLMSDKEPIKWTLRDKSIYVLNNIMSVKKEPALYNMVLESISNMISFLSLFSMGIYVSKMNFEIMAREYQKIKDIFEGEKDTLISDKLYFPLDINFQIPESLPEKNVPYLKKETAEIKKENLGEVAKKDDPNVERENFSPLSLNINKTINNLNLPGAISANSSGRKSKIMNILKENGPKTAGELSVCAPEVSGKTIQRDLVDLMEQGFVLAEGEKRWRKYFFKTSAGVNTVDTLKTI